MDDRVINGEVLSPEESRVISDQFADDFERVSRGLVRIGPQEANPLTTIANSLQLTDIQRGNIKAVMAGVGAGTMHKLLAKYFGDVPASVLGAAVGAWLAKKVLG